MTELSQVFGSPSVACYSSDISFGFFKDLKKFQLCRCGWLCLYVWAQMPGEGVESLRARGSGCRELTNVGSGKLPWILQRAATLLTTEPSLRYQHSVFKWNMLQNLRYKMGEMSHDLVKEMVSPNPWNPKLFLSSSWSAPESWAEIGVLSNLNILCSQICGVLGEGRRGQEWEHTYMSIWKSAVNASMSVWRSEVNVSLSVWRSEVSIFLHCPPYFLRWNLLEPGAHRSGLTTG